MPLYNPTSAGTVADGSITSAKILDGTIAIADLSATGTPSSSTFLRGDDTWATAGGSMATDTLADVKGDVFAATANNAIARVAVGGDGTALVADSTQSAGVAWGISYAAHYALWLNGVR